MYKVLNTCVQLLLCPIDLLFCHARVAIADVVCLRSLPPQLPLSSVTKGCVGEVVIYIELTNVSVFIFLAQTTVLPCLCLIISALYHRPQTSFVHGWTLPACLCLLFHVQVDHCHVDLLSWYCSLSTDTLSKNVAGKKLQINVSIWVNAHLPLPWPNINPNILSVDLVTGSGEG